MEPILLGYFPKRRTPVPPDYPLPGVEEIASVSECIAPAPQDWIQRWEHNDLFYAEGGRARTRTNRSGGIQGGISNGEDIVVRVAFKPTATVMHAQDTVTEDFKNTTLKGRGRHDPCVLPRAVPMVEAMAALVLVDHALRHKAQCE